MPRPKKQKVTRPKTTSLEQLPDEIREVFLAAANIYRITPHKLWQKTRKEEIVDARYIAISIIYENYGNYHDMRGYSLKKIGSFFNRHHTTVLHAFKQVKDLYETDENFRDKHDTIKETARIMLRRPRISTIINIVDSLTIENALFAEKWLRDLLDMQTTHQETPHLQKSA